MAKSLRIGDIIRVKEGMKLKVEIPEKFIYANRPFSNRLISTCICIGRLLQIVGNSEDRKRKIVEKITETFKAEQITISAEEIENFVSGKIPNIEPETFDTKQFVGEYIVLFYNDEVVALSKLDENGKYLLSDQVQFSLNPGKNNYNDLEEIEVVRNIWGN